MSQRPSDVLGGRALAIEMRTLLLLGLAWGFAYWDRMSITFLSPFIVPELHLTNFELSALPAALAFTWAIGAYLIGFWSDSTEHSENTTRAPSRNGLRAPVRSDQKPIR